MSVLAVLDALTEARIEEAVREGAFDDLPGAGRPLARDDTTVSDRSDASRLVLGPLRHIPGTGWLSLNSR